MKTTTVLACIALVTCLAVCLSFAQKAKAQESLEARAIIPLFSKAQDSPTFLVEYSNDGDADADIPSLMGGSVAVIDGVEYAQRGVPFVGNPALKPGQTKPFRIQLSGYLPGARKVGYSQELRRWRWNVPLANGRHTLRLLLGGKEYGPIAFFWEGDVTMFLKQEAPETPVE